MNERHILSEQLLQKICIVFVFNALLFNISGNFVVRAQEASVTRFNPSPTPTGTITPTPVQEAAENTGTKGGSELPQAGVNINLSLALLAAGIWSYYFYLKYKIL